MRLTWTGTRLPHRAEEGPERKKPAQEHTASPRLLPTPRPDPGASLPQAAGWGCQPCGHSGGFPTRQSTSPPRNWSCLHLYRWGRWPVAQTTCCTSWTSGRRVGPEAWRPVPPAGMPATSADSFWTQAKRERHKPADQGTRRLWQSLLRHLSVPLGRWPWARQ